MNYFDILLAQKTGYIPRNHFDALFARKIGGAVLKDFPGLPASIITVTDAIAKPLDSLKVAITPVQSGSGDPSPDNIRPISGWTGANVTRTGKNLLEEIGFINGSYIYSNGKIASDPLYRYTERYIKLNPSTTYVLTAHYKKSDNLACTVAQYDSNKKFINRLIVIPSTSITGEGTYSGSFVTRSDTLYVRCTFPTDSDALQIEVGDTATTYAPYTGQDYTITFPSEAGTVYGGTLDVTNGTLTVTDAVVDLGTLNWRYATDAGLNVFYIPSLSGAKNNGGLMCSKYVTGSPGKTSSQIIAIDKEIWWNSGGTGYVAATSLMIKDSSYTSASSFKTAMNGVQLVYKLATPITYQLTPTEVQMLLGTNNIWADTGDILEGKYWGKRSSATRAMLNTLRDAREVTEITEPEESEEPEENADER